MDGRRWRHDYTLASLEVEGVLQRVAQPYRAIGKANGYTKEQIKEYGGHIAHMVKYGV